MSLLECKDCTKPVSSSAKACPHCGCPVEMMDPPKITEKALPSEIVPQDTCEAPVLASDKMAKGDAGSNRAAPVISPAGQRRNRTHSDNSANKSSGISPYQFKIKLAITAALSVGLLVIAYLIIGNTAVIYENGSPRALNTFSAFGITIASEWVVVAFAAAVFLLILLAVWSKPSKPLGLNDKSGKPLEKQSDSNGRENASQSNKVVSAAKYDAPTPGVTDGQDPLPSEEVMATPRTTPTGDRGARRSASTPVATGTNTWIKIGVLGFLVMLGIVGYLSGLRQRANNNSDGQVGPTVPARTPAAAEPSPIVTAPAIKQAGKNKAEEFLSAWKRGEKIDGYLAGQLANRLDTNKRLGTTPTIAVTILTLSLTDFRDIRYSGQVVYRSDNSFSETKADVFTVEAIQPLVGHGRLTLHIYADGPETGKLIHIEGKN